MPIFSSGIQLCWPHECFKCRKWEILLNSAPAVERWLAGMAGDAFMMISLRKIAAEHGYDRLDRLSDQDVIRTIAEKIAGGSLKLCDRNWSAPQSVATTQGAAPAPADAFKPFPIQERVRQSASSAPAATDPPTFADNLNVAAQVRALASAAAQGVPFCPE
jgi:hypothetical protein